jgi:tetratricopeptide (TPR) repeat protein
MVEEGFLAFRQGRNADAQELFERARGSGDRRVEAQALGGLARVALRAGDAQRARELALEALELAENEAAQWSPRHLLAAAARADGDYERAAELYGETLALARRHELRLQEAAELLNLGYVALHLGNKELAIERWGQSLEIGAELGDEYLLPYCVLGAASSALVGGDRAEAARLLAAVTAAFVRTGSAIDPGSAEEYEAVLAHVAGLGTEWAEGSKLSLDEAVARARRARPDGPAPD